VSLAYDISAFGVWRLAFGVRRSAFGVHDSEIVFVLELGLHCSSALWTVTKRFLPRDGWDLPSPAVGDYGATRRYGINVFGAGDAERQTLSAERCRLAQMRFSSQKSKNAGFGRIALANGALQYRNIRYWAADSCF
jgi:hypothetical protein